MVIAKGWEMLFVMTLPFILGDLYLMHDESVAVIIPIPTMCLPDIMVCSSNIEWDGIMT